MANNKKGNRNNGNSRQTQKGNNPGDTNKGNRQRRRELHGMQPVYFPKDMSMWEQLEWYLQKYGRTSSNIISFLSIQNAALIARLDGDVNNLSEDYKDDLCDFYEEFMAKYGQVTQTDRLMNWGDEPLLFDIAEYILEMDLYYEQKDELKHMPQEVVDEAISLVSQILSMDGSKLLSFVFNPMGAEASDTLQIPADEDDTGRELSEVFVTYDVVAMLLSAGSLVVRLSAQDGTALFGIRTDFAGHWVPISAEEMLDAHTLLPDGTRLDPEEGITYTEISREEEGE